MNIPAHWNTIDNAIAAFKNGDKAKAFKIIGGIRLRKLTSDEKKIFQIANEMMTSGSTIYEQMGYKKEVVLQKAEENFVRLFINNDTAEK